MLYNQIKSTDEKIEPKHLENLLKGSGLEHSISQDILELIELNHQNNPLFVTRNAFHLFLALVALAQADKGTTPPIVLIVSNNCLEVSLECVIQHRYSKLYGAI